MRLALWGVGNTLNEVIDDININIHSIEYFIDSDLTKGGGKKWGISIKYYKDIDLNRIDAIVITTKFYKEVLSTIEKEFSQVKVPVFNSVDQFLAFEYANISHREILQNPLYQILAANKFQYATDKRLQYLEIYDRYFSKFRGENIIFMEIGVYQGGSLKLWKDYFGAKCKIIGVDINPECERFKEEQVEIEIGSQESTYFWKYIKQKYPRIDIVLDDGGHTARQQTHTFVELFPHLTCKGIYMCEDVFTSYWSKWGGGWKNESSFVEYTKSLVDHMNTKFAPTEPFWNNAVADHIKSICYHQGIVVIEKDDVCKKLDNTLLNISRRD